MPDVSYNRSSSSCSAREATLTLMNAAAISSLSNRSDVSFLLSRNETCCQRLLRRCGKHDTPRARPSSPSRHCQGDTARTRRSRPQLTSRPIVG